MEYHLAKPRSYAHFLNSGVLLSSLWWRSIPGFFEHINLSRRYLPQDHQTSTGHEPLRRQSHLPPQTQQIFYIYGHHHVREASLRPTRKQAQLWSRLRRTLPTTNHPLPPHTYWIHRFYLNLQIHTPTIPRLPPRPPQQTIPIWAISFLRTLLNRRPQTQLVRALHTSQTSLLHRNPAL